MQNEDFEVAGQIAQGIFGHTESLNRISGRGTCNQVFLATARAARIVIRLNVDRDNREFLKEGWCMSEAAAANVSVPRSLGYGVQDGWNYNVQSFEGDRNGADCEDQISIWHWLGEAAAKFHTVPVKGFGDALIDEKEGRFQGNWQNYVADNIRSIAEDKFCTDLSDRQITGLRHRFESLADKRFAFGLCHGDLRPQNVVIDDKRMTLIDWGCAHAHIIPHFDFRELLRAHSAQSPEVRAFAAGYGTPLRLESLLPEIESLLLLCAFDVMRWARDRAPAMMAEKQREFQNFLDCFQPA